MLLMSKELKKDERTITKIIQNFTSKREIFFSGGNNGSKNN